MRLENETAWICLLALIAAARIFVFSAAMPLYGNVDEAAHFDVIKKYARGYWPSKEVERFDAESAAQIALYGSYEYFRTAEEMQGTLYETSLWRRPADVIRERAPARIAQWSERRNHEAHAPPVYYYLAGRWCRLGELLGLEGGYLSYFLRFMNIPFFVALIGLTYLFGKACFPDQIEVRMGVPLLLAFFPQDLFYSMSSDSLSAVFSLASLMLMLQWHRQSEPSVLLSLGTGTMVALTFLVKFANIAVPILFGLVLLLKIRRWIRDKTWSSFARTLPAICLAAMLPVGLWLARSFTLHGNFSGMQSNLESVRYGVRAFSQYLDHPILTPDGVWYFWSNLMRTFWRGELVWAMEPMALEATDLFYVASSTLLLFTMAGRGIWTQWNRGSRLSLASETPATRATPATRNAGETDIAIPCLWFLFLSSVLFLATISVALEFSRAFYPSEARPFFVSGRLISAALVPFLTLYVLGAARWLKPRFENWGMLVFLSATAVLMLSSEIIVSLPAFQSSFNWFHL